MGIWWTWDVCTLYNAPCLHLQCYHWAQHLSDIDCFIRVARRSVWPAGPVGSHNLQILVGRVGSNLVDDHFFTFLHCLSHLSLHCIMCVMMRWLMTIGGVKINCLITAWASVVKVGLCCGVFTVRCGDRNRMYRIYISHFLCQWQCCESWWLPVSS